MTIKNKTLLRGIIVCLLLCLCVSFAACGKGQNTETTDPGQTGVDTVYNLQVKTEGGIALEGITVYVYADQSQADLVAVAKTDAEGKASFTYAASDSYVAVLTGVAEGYVVEPYYPILGEETQIALKIQLVEGDLDSVTYKLGDVMQDFTFTAADGKEYKLSQLLQEKKAVVLNFWYLACNPCKAEFPHLQEAYAEYSDSIELLAINPKDTDNSEITAFAQELGLTFPIGAGDASWEQAMQVLGYPTTVVIDRFGTVALMHSGSIPDAQKFKDIFAFFTAEDYVQTAVKDIEELMVTEKDPNAVENPVDISGIESFQLTLEPGKVHYLNIHKMKNVWMQINNSDVFVEYGGKKFTASNGSVGLLVSAPSTFEPAYVGFGNSGKETQTFTVSFSNLPGTFENPYPLKTGEFTANVQSGNDQGVYYSYTAQEDGYLTVICKGVRPAVKYDFSVYNLVSYRYLNLSGTTDTDEETGLPAVVMPMNKGERVSVTISTLPDDSNNYPAATFTMLARFSAGDVEDIVQKEKADYAVTVTDENRNPVPGVNINLSGSESGRVSVTTDENGVAAVTVDKDNYSGVLVLPKGYEAKTTRFELTPEAPFVSLKLDTLAVTQMQDYSVRIVDDQGNPLANVIVVIGSTFGSTDKDGIYKANLPVGAHNVMIMVPGGYSSSTVSFAFAQGQTEMSIPLTKQEGNTGGNIGEEGGPSGGQGELDPTKTAYSVELVDAMGNPASNIMVTFYMNGIPVSLSAVDAEGKAYAALLTGEYTFDLISSTGATIVYNADDAVLTATKPTAKLVVSSKLDTTAFDSHYWGNSYSVYTGSTQLSLSGDVNYNSDFGTYMYVFKPAISGTYSFAISSGAQLGYYGGVNYPNGPGKTTRYGQEFFEVPVRDSEFANGNQPMLVLGIIPDEGVTELTLTIARSGDAPVELPVISYTPATVPALFDLTESGTITYVNLEGTADIQKGADGYYLNGKKLYVNIGKSAPYIAMNNLLGLVYDATAESWGTSSMGTGLKGLIYEEDQPVAVEDFTQCMRDYVTACDPENGLYPLNDDLIYMFQHAGAYMGWWNSSSPNYRFTDLSSLNTEIAWMFACCYMS